MTDKNFDRLLKDALTCEDVPVSLNESLILLAKSKKNKKAKIFKFVKAASSCAAVFVCAVAVLSYFNSDLFSQKDTAPITEVAKKSQEDKIADAENDTLNDSEIKDAEINPSAKTSQPVEESVPSQESAPVQESEPIKESEPIQENATVHKSTPVQKFVPESSTRAGMGVVSENEQAAKTQIGPDTSLSAEDVPLVAAGLPPAEEADSSEHIAESIQEDASAASMDTAFSMKRSSFPQTLDMLFNEGYDYKAVISEQIASQIAALPYAQEITFSGVSGNERFSLNEENLLTIEFAAGTIAPVQHGDLFFSVGTIQDGVLIE